MAKTRLVIFDLDGTLLDTVEDLGNAVNYALKDLGYAQHPISAYYQMVGRGIYNLFRKALPPEAVNEENVQKMADRFLPFYGAHNCDYTRPYAGITEVLEHLHAHGIHLAIASNKYQEGTEHLVDHFFGHLPFTAILGQREGFPIKPDPGIVDLAASQIPGIDRGEIVYVGDSDVDMQTGRNAGVTTIGVTWGFRSRQELENGAPWKIVDTVQQLENALLAER